MHLSPHHKRGSQCCRGLHFWKLIVQADTSVVFLMWPATETGSPFMVAPRRGPSEGLKSQKTHVLLSKRLSDSAACWRKLCQVTTAAISKLMITGPQSMLCLLANGGDTVQVRGLELTGEENDLWFTGITFSQVQDVWTSFTDGKTTAPKGLVKKLYGLVTRFLHSEDQSLTNALPASHRYPCLPAWALEVCAVDSSSQQF